MRAGNITQNSTGFLQLATGTTNQRPGSPNNGMIRFNTDTTSFEIFVAGSWTNFLNSATTAVAAQKIANARTIALSGDVTGSVSFDGSANVTISSTLANTTVNPGSYALAALNIDAKGRILSATNYNFSNEFDIQGGTGLALTNTGVTAGTYTNASVTVDAHGRVTAASSGASATYTGNTNQIVVDGTNTISIASNPILTGTTGFVPPMGTTAQRPSPATKGQTRFNTDLGWMETFDGSDWLQPGMGAGSNGQIQYNNNGLLAGTSNLIIDPTSGLMMFPGQAGGFIPSYPATAGAQLYGDSDAGANRLAMGWTSHNQSSNHRIQPSILTSRHAALYPWGGTGTTTPYTMVGSTFTVSGTITARSVTTISGQSAGQTARRFGLATAATAGTVAYLRQNNGNAQYVRGISANQGGWDFVCTFMVSQVAGTNGVSTRWFVGMNASTSTLPTGNLNTWTNTVGFGADTGDTQVNLYNNATQSTGTVTQVPVSATGNADRSAKVANGDCYRVRIYSPPGGSFIGASLVNLNKSTGPSSFVLTSNIPATGTFLQPWAWISTLITTSSAIDIINFVIETDLA